MGVCSGTSKCVLLVINLLFWVASAFFVYAGVSYIQSGQGVLDDVHNKPAMVSFGIAAMLFLCGLVGIAGAFSEKKMLLVVFTIVILATFTLLMYVSVILFTQRDKAMNQTDSYVEKQFDNYMSPNLTAMEYDTYMLPDSAMTLALTNRGMELTPSSQNGTPSGTTAMPATATPAGNSSTDMSNTVTPTGNTTSNGTTKPTTTVAPTTVTSAVVTTAAPGDKINATKFVDDIQEKLHCCGYTNYTDYNSFTYWKHHNKVPGSCCNKTALSGNHTCPKHLDMTKDLKLIYDKACKDEVETVVTFVYDFMQWTGVAFCILVFLGFCSTMFLMFRKRRDGFNYESIVA